MYCGPWLWTDHVFVLRGNLVCMCVCVCLVSDSIWVVEILLQPTISQSQLEILGGEAQHKFNYKTFTREDLWCKRCLNLLSTFSIRFRAAVHGFKDQFRRQSRVTNHLEEYTNFVHCASCKLFLWKRILLMANAVIIFMRTTDPPPAAISYTAWVLSYPSPVATRVAFAWPLYMWMIHGRIQTC